MWPTPPEMTAFSDAHSALPALLSLSETGARTGGLSFGIILIQEVGRTGERQSQGATGEEVVWQEAPSIHREDVEGLGGRPHPTAKTGATNGIKGPGSQTKVTNVGYDSVP